MHSFVCGAVGRCSGTFVGSVQCRMGDAEHEAGVTVLLGVGHVCWGRGECIHMDIYSDQLPALRFWVHVELSQSGKGWSSYAHSSLI